MNNEDILKANEALNKAKTPTNERHGYYIKEDGSAELFHLMTHDEIVRITNKSSNTKVHKDD